MDYEGNRDWCSKFEGTLTHKKEVSYISYTSGGRDFNDQDTSPSGDFDDDENYEIKEALENEVFSAYK